MAEREGGCTMKSVLLSIRPKWCELIAKGDKTIEIRKTRPKLEPPFKVYIYMTAGDAVYPVTINGSPYTCSNVGGKCVIGEFVCDKILYWQYVWLPDVTHICDMSIMACVSVDELLKYANTEHRIYGWHISDLVIYEREKKLTDFRVPCREYDKDRQQCGECEYYYYECNESVGFYDECGCDGMKHITRPPQSWCYVEEVKA